MTGKFDRYMAATAVNHHSMPVASGTVAGDPLLLVLPGAGGVLIPAQALTDEAEGDHPTGYAAVSLVPAYEAYRVLVAASGADIQLGSPVYHDDSTPYSESGNTTPLSNAAGGTRWGTVVCPPDIVVTDGSSAIVAVMLGTLEA